MRTPPIFLTVLVAASLAVAAPSPVKVPKGVLVEGLECLSDPTQTYTLYLPTAYTTETRWPVLLVLDPRGRSLLAAEIFREAAEQWGWVILSSNDTRSDGLASPNLKALNALWPELHNRYASDARRVYAAGMSGGGHFAYMLGKQTGELAGVIVSGSRLLPDQLEDTTFALFAAAGDRDFNYQQMREVDRFVAEQGNPHRFEVFSGLHAWMPAELAADAVAWMELVAMARDLRAPDEAIVSRLYASDLTAADDLEASGQLLDAVRRLEMMARTYHGLADTAEVEQSMSRLTAMPRFKKARKQERKWRSFEARTRRRFAEVYARLRREDEPMTTTEVRLALDVPGLKRRASADGMEGVTARRLLSTLYVETSYYLTASLIEDQRWEAAAAALTVATEVCDDRETTWPTWYNLACVHARSRHRRDALHALQRAVDEGFSDADHLRSDPDLESLHDMDEFKAIVASLES